MEKKIVRRTIEEQILATQEKLEKLKIDRQKKTNKIVMSTLSFLHSEPEILVFLSENYLNKEFTENFKKHILEYEEFKSISRVAKSEVPTSEEGDLNGNTE